jgi:transposase
MSNVPSSSCCPLLYLGSNPASVNARRSFSVAMSTSSRSAYERDEFHPNRVGISQISRALIQDAGWKRGQHLMARPYPLDLRERMVAAVEKGGKSCNAAAAHFGVGISTAINWVRRWREKGSLQPSQIGGYKPKAISGDHRVWLMQRITERAFTLRGLVGELRERGLIVDCRSVWNFAHDEKPSFKKSVAAGERDRPDVAWRRAQWRKYQDRIEPERLVFIDETWMKTSMAPLRGGPRVVRGFPPKFRTAAGRR